MKKHRITPAQRRMLDVLEASPERQAHFPLKSARTVLALFNADLVRCYHDDKVWTVVLALPITKEFLQEWIAEAKQELETCLPQQKAACQLRVRILEAKLREYL